MSLESQESPERSRTFEEILNEDYGGNLKGWCRTEGFLEHYGRLLEVFTGRVSPSTYPTLFRNIAAHMGEPQENLFPEELYRQRLFSRMQDTPGFQLLSERYGLIHNKKAGGSLMQLFVRSGFSKTDYNRFWLLQCGLRSVEDDATFAERIAQKFGFQLEELFPPDLYQADAYRVPFGERSISLEHHQYAQSIAKNMLVSYGDELEEKVPIQYLLKQILELSTLTQRSVLHSLFFEGDRTQKEAANLHEISQARVQDILRKISSKVHKRRPYLINFWNEIMLERGQSSDRVII